MRLNKLIAYPRFYNYIHGRKFKVGLQLNNNERYKVIIRALIKFQFGWFKRFEYLIWKQTTLKETEENVHTAVFLVVIINTLFSSSRVNMICLTDQNRVICRKLIIIWSLYYYYWEATFNEVLKGPVHP